jgi:NAD(P)-dependent dehydrogenase (short-subunit alcohol dehydrogenase family)
LGPFRVTQAFAPLLIASKGRISTTGSLSGTVTWGLGGPYTMSKFAIEAYTDVLAAEMERFEVKVSIVEPGNYKSRISVNMVERLAANGYSTEGSLFAEQMNRVLGGPQDRAHFQDPDDVAAAFLHAMSDENPQRRYLVVPNQGEAEVTIRAALMRLAQLNEKQPFAYSRDQLVKMLDEALAAQ